MKRHLMSRLAGWSALSLSVMILGATFAIPAAAQPAVTITRSGATVGATAAVTKRLLNLPTATIKVNNAALGDRNQISLTWEVWAPSPNVAVTLSAGHQVVMDNPNVALTAVANGGFGSGPQTIQLSTLANVGNAFVIGLNQMEVDVKTPDGVGGSAVASFVLPGTYASIPIPPRAEQQIYVIWRVVELIQQDPPDTSTIAISVSLAGQQIYPTPTASTTINSCYKKYFPDLAHRDQFGWFGDCGEQSFLIPGIVDFTSSAALALDAAGSPAAFTITATVADTNRAAAFPLAVGPFSVTVSPTVAGLIPQFPITISQEDFLNPEKNRSMKTGLSIHQNGQIVAQTTLHNGIQLTGYQGCVYVALYDQNANSDPNGLPFYQAATQAFGIDGAFIAGTPDRNVTWTAQITPPVTVNLIGTVAIAQYTCPNDPHRDWNSWSAPLFSVIDEGAKAYALYKAASGSGGSGGGGGSGGNNVSGSGANNTSAGQKSGSSSPSG